MTVVFFSSILNHHQVHFCDMLYSILGDNFTFVSCMELEEQRVKLGYEKYIRTYNLEMHLSDENKSKAYKLSQNSDIMIAGVYPESFLRDRMSKNMITFKYQERCFKKSLNIISYLRSFYSINKKYFKYKNKNLYLLCASAFTASDYNKVGLFKEKSFKWGYFPKSKNYDIDTIISGKNKLKVSIIWVGRLIELKRCDFAIKTALKLKQEKYDFSLKIIGTGSEEKKLKKLVLNNKLSDCVEFLGSMSSQDVLNKMKETDIFLFTSTQEEGWGAVLNEAMNSGCAAITYKKIGSAPFLINEGTNGFLFNNIDDLFLKTKILINDEKLRIAFQKNAYISIKEKWNGKLAAERFIEVCQSLIINKKIFFFKDGPMSKTK